jgi:hypothetical protein
MDNGPELTSSTTYRYMLPVDRGRRRKQIADEVWGQSLRARYMSAPVEDGLGPSGRGPGRLVVRIRLTRAFVNVLSPRPVVANEFSDRPSP